MPLKEAPFANVLVIRREKAIFLCFVAVDINPTKSAVHVQCPEAPEISGFPATEPA